MFLCFILVPRHMLETACDRIEQFCKDHYPVINSKRVIPKLRHQESMAVMVMEQDTPSSSSADEFDEALDEFLPSVDNGSFTTSNYVKRPQAGIPRLRRDTEKRLTSMSAKQICSIQINVLLYTIREYVIHIYVKKITYLPKKFPLMQYVLNSIQLIHIPFCKVPPAHRLIHYILDLNVVVQSILYLRLYFLST